MDQWKMLLSAQVIIIFDGFLENVDSVSCADAESNANFSDFLSTNQKVHWPLFSRFMCRYTGFKQDISKSNHCWSYDGARYVAQVACIDSFQ